MFLGAQEPASSDNRPLGCLWTDRSQYPCCRHQWASGRFVCLCDHNSKAPRPICFKFWLGNSMESREFSSLCFKIFKMSRSTFIGKIDKIIIFNQVRVNGKNNYRGVNPPPPEGERNQRSHRRGREGKGEMKG